MTESTPAVITMLHGELEKAGEDKEARTTVVNNTCKPVIRNLAKNYDEEDEKAKRAKTAMAAKEAAMIQKESAAHINEFLVAAYVMIANEITRDKKWPWALPDPHDLAIKAHKKIQNRLLHVRFRDNLKLMSSVLIDYEEDDLKYGEMRAAVDLLEAPYPDDEAGADADEESGEA